VRSKNVAYSPEIDHLRFVAAFAVFAFHYFHHAVGGWRPRPDAPWAAIVVDGYTGVGLFLVLSGYLFTRIALDGGDIRYGAFLRNRVLRIAPLVLVVFAVAVSINRDEFRPADILYLLFTNVGRPPTSEHFVTGAAWSISLEFTFYLVFPFLIANARALGPGHLVKLVVLLLVVKVGAFMVAKNATLMLYSTLVGRFDQFLIGMLAALLHRRHETALAARSRMLFPASLLVLLVCLGLQARYASFLGGAPRQHAWIVWPTVEAVLWASVIVAYLSLRPPLPPALRNLAALGGVWSFSLYLWHPLVIFLAVAAAPVGPQASALYVLLHATATFGLAMAFSWLSFTAIEEPFLRMRGRYVTADEPSAPRPAPP